ncbi:MAG: T9SS type A sorting domain-containing protein [Bacteroidia bacterium]|nr:T9SS type A sorting domain-containing protein [Bacteroidia bacterium]
MIFLFLTSFLLLSCFNLHAQPPYWQWATMAGGSAEDKSLSIATDISGSIYITGHYFSPNIVFGTDTLSTPSSMFLAKYNANGNPVWARSATGNTQNYGNSVATDNAGYVYVTGYATNAPWGTTITFGPYTLNKGMYLVKYDSSGNVIWARDAVKPGGNGLNLCADPFGNIILSGGHNGDTLFFGNDTIVQYICFIAKYDSSGNALWGKGVTATDGILDADGPYLSADKYGNVYAAGGFFEPVGRVDTVLMINNGSYDAYLAKFNAAGQVQWAHNYGSWLNSQASSVACDTAGNVYITGFFTDNSITFDTITLTAPGSSHAFIVKFNPAGSALWARKIMWLWGTNPIKVAVDNNNDVYLTGYFGLPGSPGFLFTPTDSLTNPGLFLAKYDSNGNFKWARDAINWCRSTDVAVGPDGTPYITGYFSNPSLIFDSNVLLHSPSNNSFDIYIAAMGSFTGMEETDGNSPFAFSVFPNPNSGQFYVVSNVHELTSVAISDMMGRIVLNQTVKAGLHFMDLTMQPKGIYIVTLRTAKSSSAKKVVLY